MAVRGIGWGGRDGEACVVGDVSVERRGVLECRVRVVFDSRPDGRWRWRLVDAGDNRTVAVSGALFGTEVAAARDADRVTLAVHDMVPRELPRWPWALSIGMLVGSVIASVTMLWWS